jgi:EPS-associated MarR family transcriptional regulator
MAEQIKEYQDVLDSEKSLLLIKEIERNPELTQRYLASKLSVSLGRVNFLIQALSKRGIIKIQNFKQSKNKLGYMYILTPRGFKTKIVLVRKFIAFKTQEYERLKREIEELKTMRA